MPNIMLTGLSALLTSQRALATTGHNIANVNTPGYSRQRVDLATRVPGGLGNLAIGNGVYMTSVSRSYDSFQATELRLNQSAFSRLDSFHGLAARVDGLVADQSAGLAPSLQAFFSAAQDVANDPASMPARQAFLSQADGVADRFQSLAGHFESMEREISGRLRQEIADIDSLARSIAQINKDIVAASGGATGQPPNDLLDHRDRLLDQLSEKVAVSTFEQDDGALNVFIGSGQSLVVGAQSAGLSVQGDPFDQDRANIIIDNGVNRVDISSSLSGGTVGGILDFRREVLDTARNEVGRVAMAFAATVNEQHAAGMDLNGSLGGQFFSVSEPTVLLQNTNAGTADATATINDLGAIQGTDYLLNFSGGGYSLSRTDTGEPVTMTGSGTVADPFVADGLSIVTTGAAVDGDRFLIRPAYDAASSLTNVLGSPRDIAAAGPLRSSADGANIGDATISAGEVTDAANPGLLSNTVIEFLSPTTYSVNGAGSFAYTAGAPIDVNGASFVIDGAPEPGDTFSIEPNVGGLGDNRNMLAIGELQSQGILDGGASSVSNAVGQLVAQVGTTTRYASSNLDAQGVLLEQSINQQQSVSGVNLDEEAANMLRYQQSYEAAAQIISVADSLFRSLLNAVGR